MHRQGQSAIADIAKFKDYSPLGDEIQVDPSMKSQNYYKTSFTLAKSSTPTASFALITPYDSYSLCLDETDSSIPITYVMQTSDNENPEIAEVNYKLTLTRKTGTLAGKINLQRGTNTYEITDDIQNFVSTIKGDSVQEGKLTYDVVLKTKNQNEIKRTESIDLHIRYPAEGSTCDDYSIYGTQSYLEQQKEETDTEGEGGKDAASDMDGK